MSILTESEPGVESPAEYRRPARAVLASLGLTVLAFVLSIAGGLVLVVPILLFGLELDSLPVLVALTAVGQVGFLLVGYAYARLASVRVRVAVPTRRDLGYALGGTVGALALAVGLSALLSVLGLTPGSVLEDAVAAQPTLLLALAALSVLLVAPAEEFLFRGVIQTRLRRAFGPIGAVAGASLLFGSLHLANYTGPVAPIVAGALLITSVGVVFGVVYERTGNLVVPVLTHGVYNLVLFVIAFLTL
jgi:hypothetical protein